MEFVSYKERIKERLEGYFDIEENHILQDISFDLYGFYNIRSEKYVASKKFTIYAFENDEYVLLKYYPQMDKKILNNFVNILKENIDRYVTPHDDHMSSTISGVLVVDNVEDEEIIKEVEKFKYQKSFFFGLKGWVDIRLILVDLQNEKVITCKKGKNAVKFYQP